MIPESRREAVERALLRAFGAAADTDMNFPEIRQFCQLLTAGKVALGSCANARFAKSLSLMNQPTPSVILLK